MDLAQGYLDETIELREKLLELLKAAKTLSWGQNRIVQEYWDKLQEAITKAER